MQELQIFNNPEFGEIRSIEIDGEPWFVGRDIATALGYVKPTDAVRKHIDEDDTLKRGIIDGMGRTQQTTIINESGMYALIIMSELPSAKKFKRWITKEVIPTIVKTGSYNLQQLTPNELILQMAQANVELERKINALEESQSKIEESQLRIEQKFEAAVQVFSNPSVDHWKEDIEAMINQLSVSYCPNTISLKGKLYKELEKTVPSLCLSNRQKRLRTRLRDNGKTYTECHEITKLDVISRNKELRPIFESIIKKHLAIHAAGIE